MRYIGWLLLFIGAFFFTRAQKAFRSNPGKLMGRVIDSVSNELIEYATVSVFPYDSKQPVSVSATNNKGIFKMDNLPLGNYTLVIGFIGYKQKTQSNISLTSQSPIYDIGNIVLSSNAQILGDVTVGDSKNIVENRIDRIIYDATKDISSQGGLATDVLKKVPYVSVDINGNIRLQGSSSIQILINGKPSAIFGSNPADALQTIPASQIKTVEVLTIPGAKYDAEGTGGIINIILKDSKVRGLFGTVALSAGTRLENGAASVNIRNGSLGITASVSGNAQLKSNTLNGTDRTTIESPGINSRLIQDGQGTYSRGSSKAQVGFDWDINKKNNLNGSLSYNDFSNNTSAYINQQRVEYNAGGNVLSDSSILRSSNTSSNVQSVEGYLDYRRKFKKEGQELDFSYQTGLVKNNSYYHQHQLYKLNDSLFSGAQSNNWLEDRETVIQANYSHPFTENVLLETGIKGTLSRISSNSDFYCLNPFSKEYVSDSSQANSFNYQRNIYAAYLSMTFPLLGKYIMKLGGRFERTVTDADFKDPLFTPIAPYNNFIPSGIISRTLKNNQGIKLSYAGRIQRPGYRMLNPFINASDPTDVITGNPALKPELSDNVELSYSKTFEKGSSVMASLYNRHSTEDLQEYTYYYPSLSVGDSLYKNVALNTTENVGIQNSTGINLYGNAVVTNKLNIRGYFNLFYLYIKNQLKPYNISRSFNYRLNVNVTYQFSKDLVGEFFGNFNSALHEIQGTTPSYLNYSFAFRKLLWNKKGSIGFTTNTPFQRYINFRAVLNGDNFSMISYQKIPYRSFGVSFTYRFGKKIEWKKQKEYSDGSEEE